jgi:hypothetical protein
MIVVGINVALWFEGWFEELGERDTEQQYLLELRVDLQTDIGELDRVIASNTAKVGRLQSLVESYAELATKDANTLAQAIFEPSSYSFFEPSDVTYQSLIESGDFRLISDPDLKKGLLKLTRRWNEIETLQNNYLQAIDDEYIPLMMRTFDLVEMKVTDPSLFSNQLFKNFFAYALQDMERLSVTHTQARDQTDAVLASVNAAIEGN